MDRRDRHRPSASVVLVAQPLDTFHGHTDLLVPDLLSLIVGLVHRDPQLISVDAPAALLGRSGDQVPAPRDRRLLEVVTETEVAHHLEEHEMSLRATDIVEVVVLATGAGTLLRGRCTLERRLLVANEVVLERHHAGNVEEHRGIVRNQARRLHDGVVLCGEEAGEGVAQLVGRHVALESAGHIAADPTEQR